MHKSFLRFKLGETYPNHITSKGILWYVHHLYAVPLTKSVFMVNNLLEYLPKMIFIHFPYCHRLMIWLCSPSSNWRRIPRIAWGQQIPPHFRLQVNLRWTRLSPSKSTKTGGKIQGRDQQQVGQKIMFPIVGQKKIMMNGYKGLEFPTDQHSVAFVTTCERKQ